MLIVCVPVVFVAIVPLLSLQRNNNENRNTLGRCASVGRQLRSGSVATLSNRINKPNNNLVDSDGTDGRSINHDADPPTSRQRAFSTMDLSFGNRSNQNWSNMGQPQFMHNHGYPYQHPVISIFIHISFV